MESLGFEVVQQIGKFQLIKSKKNVAVMYNNNNIYIAHITLT